MRIVMEEKEETRVQMAPMIDMVFLLIIFFMTASHLSATKSKTLDIPVADRGVVPKDRPDRWTVNILPDGAIFSGQQPVTVDELKRLVTERVKQDPQMKVYLRADKTTPHRQVKAVMSAMAEAGVGDFIFGVFSPGGEGGAE
ncbi:MAG: biopolymer transporter ExbD [Kiritimatiellia bacterium]|jgi:biopolymer transport protein ExbD|nr:biopolymer transporter ExbD [Kiritimatiellia bacterium]